MKHLIPPEATHPVLDLIFFLKRLGIVDDLSVRLSWSMVGRCYTIDDGSP